MGERRILVVEDEAIVAMDIRDCLTSFGYEVVGTASTGEEAIQKAKALTPSLVLMDIRLAGAMDGIGAAKQIKDELKVPIIFLTAHADPATLERVKVTEPYGYVLKPFKQMELRTAVELALHKHSQDQKRAEEAKSAAEREAAKSPEEYLNAVKIVHEPDSQLARRILSSIKKVEPFSRLPDDLLRQIAVRCYFEDFGAGDVITAEGAKEASGFIAIFGRVSMFKSSAKGKDLIVELLPALDAFGLLAAIEKGPYPLTARAQIDTRILRIPRPLVLLVLDRYPDLARDFISSILERLRKAHDLSRALAHDLVEVRIASSLLALITRFFPEESFKEPYEVPITRQEIADLAGTTPETVSRVMKVMERDGLVDLSQVKTVRVLNSKGLASFGH